MTELTDQTDTQLTTWVPSDSLDILSNDEVLYSNGFLRARFEKWFPGFPAQWQALLHNLGIQTRFIGIRPQLQKISDFSSDYVLSVGSELLFLEFNPELVSQIVNLTATGLNENGSKILVEYYARRILRSLEMAWTGPQLDRSQYLDKTSTKSNVSASIQVLFELNSKEVSLNFYLTAGLLDLLDQLWRKQLHSRTTQDLRRGRISIEVAHMFLEARMLSQVIRKGQIINIDQNISDRILLLHEERPWLPGKLYQTDGKYVAKVLLGAPPASSTQAQKVRLSAQIAQVDINPYEAIELNQSGAIISTNQVISPEVELKVNKEILAKGIIKHSAGKMAIEII